MGQWSSGAIRALGLALLLAACGDREAGDGAMQLSFEDRTEPGAFETSGDAVRDGGGADGLWASVPGLPRPERALVRNLDSGAEVTVALFRGSGRGGIRLSGPAAEALGIGDRPVPVRVTAVRSVPEVDYR